MLKIHGFDIELARGDSASIDISFKRDPPENGTRMLFSVNNHRGVVFEKFVEVIDGTASLELNSADTDIKEWSYTWGLYVYNTETNGYAPVTEAKFKVKRSEAWRGTVTV